MPGENTSSENKNSNPENESNFSPERDCKIGITYNILVHWKKKETPKEPPIQEITTNSSGVDGNPNEKVSIEINEPAKENSQSPENDCEITLAYKITLNWKNKNSSTGPLIEEIKETPNELKEAPNDKATSDTVPEESACSKSEGEDMYTNNQTQISKESSQSPKDDCEVMVASEDVKSSIGLHLKEIEELSGGFKGYPNDCATSDTVPEESVCSKCAGTKLNICTELESSPKVQPICQCRSKIEEKQVKNRTNLESHVKVLDTEKDRAEIQSMVKLERVLKEKLLAHELNFPGDFVERIIGNSSTNLEAESFVVKQNPPSTECRQENDAKLFDVKEENIPTHTAKAVDEIKEGNESYLNQGRLVNDCPDISRPSSTREFMSSNSDPARCSQDFGYSDPNHLSFLEERLQSFVRLCLILFPVLVFISVALAYKLWSNNSNRTDSNITKDIASNVFNITIVVGNDLNSIMHSIHTLLKT